MGDKVAISDSITCILMMHQKVDSALREALEIGSMQYSILSFFDVMDDSSTPGDIVAAFGLCASDVSYHLKKLAGRGMIEGNRNPEVPQSIVYSLTKNGYKALGSCDFALISVFDGMFAPVDSKTRMLLMNGSLLTATAHSIARMRNGKHFNEYGLFEGNLMSVLFFTKCACSHGISLNEYRCLLLLSEKRAPLKKVDLSKLLRIPKSSITNCVLELAKRGLVHESVDNLDKRSSLVKTTAAGMALTDEISRDINEYNDALRPTGKGEMSALNEALLDVLVSQG